MQMLCLHTCNMEITVTLQNIGKYKSLQWVTLDKELYHKYEITYS